MGGWPVVLLTSWLAASTQTATTTITSTTTGTSTIGAAPACPPAAERTYQRGFDALVEDDPRKAVELFDRVERICPAHPLATEMKRFAVARADAVGVELDELEPGAERPSLLAWGELLAFQTLHGVAQGVLLCFAAGCDDARAAAVTGFVGASVGAGLSIIGFKRIRSGQASAINSGTGWGIWNAIALSILAEPNDRVGPAVASGTLLAGTLGGVAAALLLEPKNGSVSFANSSGIWLGVTTFWIMVAAKADFERTTIPVELAVTHVGLIAGAIASRYLNISRGRVLLIDAGGVVGSLLGVGITAIINTDFPPRILGTLSAVGTVGGLIGTFFLTAPIDEPDEEEEEDPTTAWWVVPSGPGLAIGGTF